MSWLLVIISYLIGAIPFGYIIVRIAGSGDIRQAGSGNVGATNAWRTAGPLAGILVLVFDIVKGISAVLLAALVAPPIDPEIFKLLCGVAAIVGHVFPVYLRFRGGKGVNAALGVMVLLLPLEILAAVVVFILTVLVSRFVSLGSILAAVTLCVLVFAERIFDLREMHLIYLPVTLFLALFIIYTHRSNIGRLLVGRENKFNLHAREDVGS